MEPRISKAKHREERTLSFKEFIFAYGWQDKTGMQTYNAYSLKGAQE